MSVREDSLVAEQKIRTVLPNLIKLKEAVVNILHVSGIFRKKISRLWKSLKMVLRFPRATYEREEIKKVDHLITSYIWVLINGSIVDLLSMSW